jgi:hypothetical protein
MKTFSKMWLVLFAAAFVFTTGCATSRGVVNLQQTPAKSPAQSNGKKVLINSVLDIREFQDNPPSQDIPSLGSGGMSAATPEEKKRAIARKRNSYGKAMGDILLQEGQTVETVMNDALRRSFAEMGYTVLQTQQQASTDTMVIDSTIQKFWGYMKPGVWSITLSSDISTTLQVKPPNATSSQSETITVKSEEGYQTGAESNYLEVINKAIDKYVEQVETTFTGKY